MIPNSPSQDPSFASTGNTALMRAGCCVAIGSLIPVALYQTGAIAHLPDPPLDVFDSDAITRSKAAHPFGIPDAVLGLASFGATFALILASRHYAASRRLLAVKLTMDTIAAVFSATRQVVSFRRLCSWCTVTALAAGVSSYGGREVIRTSLLEARATVRGEK